MSFNRVSSYVMNTSLLSFTAQAKADMSNSSYEAVTGRVKEPGLTNGRQTSSFIDLRNRVSTLDGFLDSNNVLASRMKATQASLQSLVAASSKDYAGGALVQFNKALMGDGVSVVPATMQSAAQTALDSFVSAMNTSFNGEYVFGGTNVTEPPLQNYKAGSNENGSQIVQNAFRSYFGFDLNSPNVANITKEQMEAFIDGPFDKLFEEPSWSTNFSKASDEVLTNRISDNGETVDVSVSANESGFRHAMKNLVLVAEFGNIGLGKDAQQVLSDRARASTDNKSTGSAITEIITSASILGSSENRVKNANSLINSQKSLFTQLGDDMIAVDKTEASTKIKQLELSIELSNTLTSRIFKLSLVNYLSN